MKYEEIEVGESYVTDMGYKIKVISKNDDHKAVMTIDEVGDFLGWSEKEIKNFQPLKKELPKTGLLISESGTMMFRTGDVTGYGFFVRGEFKTNAKLNFKTHPEVWSVATKQEEVLFKSWVKEELIKRGLVEGIEFKSLLECDVIYEMGDDFSFNEDGIFSGSACIFHEGVWAEPLVEELPKTSIAKSFPILHLRENRHAHLYPNYISYTAKKNSQEVEKIKQLEDRVEKLEEEFNSGDKEPEKKKAWWRN